MVENDEKECPIISQVNLFIAILEEVKSRCNDREPGFLDTEEWKNYEAECYKKLLSYLMTKTSENKLAKYRLYNRGRTESNYRYKEENELFSNDDGATANIDTKPLTPPRIYSNLSHEAPEFIPQSQKTSQMTNKDYESLQNTKSNKNEKESTKTEMSRPSEEIGSQKHKSEEKASGFRPLNPSPTNNHNNRKQQKKSKKDYHILNDGQAITAEEELLRIKDLNDKRAQKERQKMVEQHHQIINQQQLHIQRQNVLHSYIFSSARQLPPSPMDPYYNPQVMAIPPQHQLVTYVPNPSMPLPVFPPPGYKQASYEVHKRINSMDPPSRSYPSYCTYCKSLGYPREMYMSHSIRNPMNHKAICPNLRKLICDRCHATGDNAHNDNECPFNLINEETISSSRSTSTSSNSSSVEESTSFIKLPPIISRKVSFTASIEKANKIKNVRII